MYASSTASSSAYASRRHAASSSTSSSRHPDERLSNGPLTSERAMMEKIRTKLERTQQRMARERATGSSQQGYNSSRAMPMSGVVASHHHHHHRVEYQSTSRHTHSHHHHHHESTSTVASSRYPVPSGDYRSTRAPTVPSVYLEDLPMAIHASQRAPPPPSTRGPTSYAPGSTAAGYYAPELDESYAVRSRHVTSTRHVRSQHREAAPVASRVHVRSERHAIHHLQQEHAQHHHHHHHHHHAHAKEMTASNHQQHRRLHDATERPPPSTRGILRKTSSFSQPPSATMPLYGNENTPPSNLVHRKASQLDAPPRTTNGKPQRGGVASRAHEDNDTAASDASVASVAPPPPPSSRVRFEDEELRAAIAYPPLVEEEEEEETVHEEQPLEFLGEELPYDPEDDLVFQENESGSDNNDDDYYGGGDYDADVDAYAEPDKEEPPHAELEPTVEIKQTHAVETGGEQVRSGLEDSSPAQLLLHTPDRMPHRRRGSSAARTPPTLSPSASYVRKSLTEPPKSAIDASQINRFDIRERRASKEKHLTSNASGGDQGRPEGEVDIDALAASAASAMGAAPPLDAQGDEFATTNMGVYSAGYSYDDAGSDSDYSELSDGSQGSLHESHLAFDDDEAPSVPPPSFLPYRRSNVSPSSTDDYSDAHAFPDEDDDDSNTAAVAQSTPEAIEAVAVAAPLAANEQSLWPVAGSDDSDDDDVQHTDVTENQTASTTETKPLSTRQPKLRASKAPYFGFQSRNVNAFATSVASERQQSPPSTPASTPSSPETAPTRAASKVAAAVAPPVRQRHQRVVATRDPNNVDLPYHDHRHEHHHAPSSRKPMPMPLSQSLMMLAPPSAARSGHRPPPASTHIRPSPATARLSSSLANSGGMPRAPVTADGSLAGSTYVPRRLRPKNPQASHVSARKALPPSIGALSGLASGPVTFELNVSSFYEVEWTTGEFGFSFQRVYLEETDANGEIGPRQMFLRMLLNTERGTCPSFKQIHLGDVLVEIDGTRVCDIKLDKNGGGAALTRLFTELRAKTPLRLVFQRMDPTSWEGGVEL